MLSFGWTEIALTVVVVVIVIGPKEIPNLLKQLGVFSKSIKKVSREFKKSLNDLADEGDFKEVKNSIKDMNNIKKNLDIKGELKEEIKSLKDTITFTDKEINDINNKIKKD